MTRGAFHHVGQVVDLHEASPCAKHFVDGFHGHLATRDPCDEPVFDGRKSVDDVVVDTFCTQGFRSTLSSKIDHGLPHHVRG